MLDASEAAKVGVEATHPQKWKPLRAGGDSHVRGSTFSFDQPHAFRKPYSEYVWPFLGFRRFSLLSR